MVEDMSGFERPHGMAPSEQRLAQTQNAHDRVAWRRGTQAFVRAATRKWKTARYRRTPLAPPPSSFLSSSSPALRSSPLVGLRGSVPFAHVRVSRVPIPAAADRKQKPEVSRGRNPTGGVDETQSLMAQRLQVHKQTAARECVGIGVGMHAIETEWGPALWGVEEPA